MANRNRPARQRIINALVDLLQEREYEDIPVKLLISHAGVYPSTYYYNFHKIDDVADALVEQFLQSFRDASTKMHPVTRGGKPAMDRESEAGEDVYRFVYDNKRSFYALMRAGKMEEFRSRYTETITRETLRWKLRPYASDGSTVKMSEKYLEYLLFNRSQQLVSYLESWARHGFDLSPHEMLEMSITFSRVEAIELVSFRK